MQINMNPYWKQEARIMANNKKVIVNNFINGEFMQSSNYLNSYDPSTGEVWALIADSDRGDVDAAVATAKQAFLQWSSTSVKQRAKILTKIADLLESRLDEFARAESKDQGKPVTLARTVDIPRAIHNFRFFASAIQHHLNISNVLDEVGAFNYTTRQAVGVAGLISPWNLPLYLLTFKLAPALACGNTVVCKPSEMTSVTAWMLCSLMKDAGLPDGVVNMVFGLGSKAGSHLAAHPDVLLLSFTGSTATAKKIRAAAAEHSKKLSLELGGKNPAVVFNDVSLDEHLPTLVRSSFANQGEICLCSSRIFVQKEIYEEFVEKFVELARNIVVGDPQDPTTAMGALISLEHLNKVKGFVATAKEEKAKIRCGDEELNLPNPLSKGYFMRPTVITDVSDCSSLMQDEIFGPVVCIVPFSTENEVVARANSVKYGLSASVWGSNLSQVHRVAQKISAGTVWCNCWMVRDLHMPFGGTKASGIGREGVSDSIDFYTEVKTVCVKV